MDFNLFLIKGHHIEIPLKINSDLGMSIHDTSIICIIDPTSTNAATQQLQTLDAENKN